MAIPPTSVRDAWALVRCGGTAGKRSPARMAYLTSIVAQHGQVVGYRGFIMRSDLTGWTKHPQYVREVDILKSWRFDRQPTVAQVEAAKRRLPVYRGEDIPQAA